MTSRGEESDPATILEELKTFYGQLYRSRSFKTEAQCYEYLKKINTPHLSSVEILNVDAKILSKILATHMKRVIHKLIGASAYVSGRHITDAIRPVSNLLYYTDQNNLNGYVVSVDMEKAFDSIEHTFIISTLRKYVFGPNFIKWIKVLLNKQVSCVMNNGFTIGYFTNERGTRQGDPISAYLFILVLEIPFLQVKENEKIERIERIKISSHEFLLSAFADDVTYLVYNWTLLKSFSDYIIILNNFHL